MRAPSFHLVLLDSSSITAASLPEAFRDLGSVCVVQVDVDEMVAYGSRFSRNVR